MNQRPYFEIVNPELAKIVGHLPRNLLVLDVGCGSGLHGRELTRLYGHRVVGVDLSESSIRKAATRLAEAYVADVRRPELYTFASDRRFDLIVFSDILEHMETPQDMLAGHLALLKPGGHVLISIPNVAIWNVRLLLLAGRFQYTDTGTLDRTHLRFFTKRTLDGMLREVGLRTLRRRTSPGIARPFVPLVKAVYAHAGLLDGTTDSEAIMESGPAGFYAKWIYPLEAALCRLWPGLLAFQYVVLAGAEPAVNRR